MIRFLRNLILTVVIIAAALYIAALVARSRVIDQCREPLTNTLVTAYGVGPDDTYSFNVRMHFYPPAVEVTDLQITGEALTVDGSEFHQCVLSIDSITCDLWTLARYRQVKILRASGRSFEGGLLNGDIAQRFMAKGGPISEVSVDQYNGMARVQGRFGYLSPSTITMLGRWAVDDRGVVTIVDRRYRNPDSPVPEGVVAILEQQVNFDIRISILDEELKAESVQSNQFGIRIIEHE
jgi:hypothetical protein